MKFCGLAYLAPNGNDHWNSWISWDLRGIQILAALMQTEFDVYVCLCMLMLIFSDRVRTRSAFNGIIYDTYIDTLSRLGMLVTASDCWWLLLVVICTAEDPSATSWPSELVLCLGTGSQFCPSWRAAEINGWGHTSGCSQATLVFLKGGTLWSSWRIHDFFGLICGTNPTWHWKCVNLCAILS